MVDADACAAALAALSRASISLSAIMRVFSPSDAETE
jgi:hypothetical protein